MFKQTLTLSLVAGLSTASNMASEGPSDKCEEFISSQMGSLSSLSDDFSSEALTIFEASYESRLKAQDKGLITKLSGGKQRTMLFFQVDGYGPIDMFANLSNAARILSDGSSLNDRRGKRWFEDFCRNLKKHCGTADEQVAGLMQRCARWTTEITQLRAASVKVQEALEEATISSPVPIEKRDKYLEALIAFESEIFKSVVQATLFVVKIQRVSDILAGKPVQAEITAHTLPRETLSMQNLLFELEDTKKKLSRLSLSEDLESRALNLVERVSSLINIRGFSKDDIMAYISHIPKKSISTWLQLIEETCKTVNEWIDDRDKESERSQRIWSSFIASMPPFFRNFDIFNTGPAVLAIERSQYLRQEEIVAGRLAVGIDRTVCIGDSARHDAMVTYRFNAVSKINPEVLKARESLAGPLRQFCDEFSKLPKCYRPDIEILASRIKESCSDWFKSYDLLIAQIRSIQEQLDSVNSAVGLDTVKTIHSMRIDLERTLMKEVLRPKFFAMQLRRLLGSYTNRNFELPMLHSPLVDILPVQEVLRDSVILLESFEDSPNSQFLFSCIDLKLVAKYALPAIERVADNFQIGEFDGHDLKVLLSENPEAIIDTTNAYFRRFIQLCLEATGEKFEFSVPLGESGQIDESRIFSSLSVTYIANAIRGFITSLQYFHDLDRTPEKNQKYSEIALKLAHLLEYTKKRFNLNLALLPQSETGILRFDDLNKRAQSYLNAIDSLPHP